MDQILEYFQNFYAKESLAIMAFMLISFLFGLLIGYLSRGRRIRRLENELKEREQKILTIEGERNRLKEELGLKEADLQKAQLEIGNRDAHIQQLNRDKDQLRAELATAKDVVEQFKSANQTYSATIEDLNNQLASLQAENEKLQAALDKAEGPTDNLAQMQSSFNATNTRLQLLEDKMAQLEGDNQSLRVSLDQLAVADNDGVEGNAPQQALDRLLSLENKIGNLEGENQLLKAELAQLQANQGSQDTYEGDMIAGSSRGISDTDDMTEEEEAAALVPEKNILKEKIVADDLVEKDDLTKIRGIGPFIEKKLNDLEVYTYEDISQWDEDKIEEVTKDIQYLPGRIQKDDWVGQAQQLADAKSTNNEVLGARAMAPAAAPAIRPTDLKVVEGIGPKIENLLKDNGVETVQDLAGKSADELKAILQSAGSKYRIHDPTTWPDQAKLAADEKWEELKTYQDYLVGGRDPEA